MLRVSSDECLLTLLLLNSVVLAQGFSVDGQHDSADEMDSFVSKCVMVDGNAESEDDALEGFVMKDMLVQSCG